MITLVQVRKPAGATQAAASQAHTKRGSSPSSLVPGLQGKNLGFRASGISFRHSKLSYKQRNSFSLNLS